MLLLLWHPILYHDLEVITALLPFSPPESKTMRWYTDVLYQVLQPKQTRQQNLSIVAIDLCRPSNYVACHGFWEHAKVKYGRDPQRAVANNWNSCFSHPQLPQTPFPRIAIGASKGCCKSFPSKYHRGISTVPMEEAQGLHILHDPGFQ